MSGEATGWHDVARRLREIVRRVQTAVDNQGLTPELLTAEAEYRRLAERDFGPPGRDVAADAAGLPEAIYFVPAADGQQAHFAFEYEAGPKKYLRLWFARGDARPRGGERAEWGWTLPDGALLLWTPDRAAVDGVR